MIIFCLIYNFRILHSDPGEYDFTFYIWKYQGGGDWYEGKVGSKNLLDFINENTLIKANPTAQILTLDSSALLDCFFLYATGHGLITLSDTEKKYLKDFLLSGGFLYLNDDYGLDSSVRKLITKLFPKKNLQELPKDHLLFSIYYSFPEGTPKIHKHDGKPPVSYGVFHNNRMLILYTHESDIGDGWAPYQVHKDPEDIRLKALKFGVNIVYYAMSQ